MAASGAPDVCTLLWPFLPEDEVERGEDCWLIGWNPRGLVVVVVTAVPGATMAAAQQTLEHIRGHATHHHNNNNNISGGNSLSSMSRSSLTGFHHTHNNNNSNNNNSSIVGEGRGQLRRGGPNPASLLILGRLRGTRRDIALTTRDSSLTTTRGRLLLAEDEGNEGTDAWLRSEQQMSDIWLELNKGPVLDQVWCCGYRVQPCHLHVIRTDPRLRYAASSTVFSATARFGCRGIAALVKGEQPLYVSGARSTLEGVLLPPNMIPLAGPCEKRHKEFDTNSPTRSFIKRVKEDVWDSNTSMDDVPNGNNSFSRREREKGEQQSFAAEPEDREPSPPPPVSRLPPRLYFPTSTDTAELSLLLSAHNYGRTLCESVERRENNNSNNNKNSSTGKDNKLRNQTSWEKHLHNFLGILITTFSFTLPLFTWFGKISCTAALLEFRTREIIHWLALMQGRTNICGLHPVLPHVQHSYTAFKRFCAVNFLFRLLIDGILGTLLSILLVFGGNELIAKSEIFCRCFLYDIHMGYMNWFEGWPAGLKMNEDLNMTLCFFAKLVLQLSWICLEKINWVELVYKLLVYISPFGASCAFAFLSDVCVLVSLHLLLLFHCISVPYRVMRSMMGSLFLQFNGKKYNPLRHRRDAYDFDLDQTLMGTLLFTVTVFLFPTLAVYYLYFALTRTSIWLVQESLIAAAHLTLYLPVFPIIFWVMNRRKWPGGVTITAPKVTRVRGHTNTTTTNNSTNNNNNNNNNNNLNSTNTTTMTAASSSSSSSSPRSSTVELTVISKPLELHVFLVDFLLVLDNLVKLSPLKMLALIYNAQRWESTNPVERLLPHLRKDCIHTDMELFASANDKTVTPTTTALTPPASIGAVGKEKKIITNTTAIDTPITKTIKTGEEGEGTGESPTPKK